MQVGIIGRTGSGKTSLVTRALYRLELPETGTILINGVDFMNLTTGQLRGIMAIIPQDPVLFEGTIRENLDPNNNHSDSEIWKVVEQSHATGILSKQEGNGLDTPVIGTGSNFSVGERQLLCFARILLAKAHIIVCDEATASVDYATDELIQQTIRECFNHCIVLTIAHRRKTIANYDKILVLENGEVVAFGTPQELQGRVLLE